MRPFSSKRHPSGCRADDRLQGFETDNLMLLQAVSGVHTARQGEDTAYRRYSGKDFASDDLKGSASREQSQACLSYAEAQPAFAR